MPTPSLHDQKPAIRASLGSAIRTSKHSKSTICGRFHKRSVIRRFCKIRESVQIFNEIRESVAILGQIRQSASLFNPPPSPINGRFSKDTPICVAGTDWKWNAELRRLRFPENLPTIFKYFQSFLKKFRQCLKISYNFQRP